jgi:NADPH-dependent 2,4-dienoyl-CoA reductase/sulfur reductase-like enzyme
MNDPRILVVGAGPAGLAAATALARAGRAVVLADRAPRLGGAVYAEPMTAQSGASRPTARGRNLIETLRAQADRIDLRLSTSYAGMDATGTVALTGAQGLMFRPAAVLLAVGARELVQPRPGWTTPGVTTVGALQVALKTAGAVPDGAVAIAGSGPLLYALGAQLVRAGCPPAAVIDAGRPAMHPAQVMRLPPELLREAAGYLVTLVRARVPVLAGTHVDRIDPEAGRLKLTLERKGKTRTLLADRVALHDGLARNDYGASSEAPVPVIPAGDCREVLGRFGAEEDGRRAAAEILHALADRPFPAPDARLARYRKAQARLAAIFAHDGPTRLARLPRNTVICRCENRTLASLDALPETERTPRLLRLDARFGMGACQGRGCLEWVSALAGDTRPGDPGAATLRGARWPLVPVSVADLLSATDEVGALLTHIQDPDP